ncbi:MAG: TetR/AcrR family transcriptional regulator [Anaerolineae bacterium]|nr:TetR/AcrR family transcriptional regulator [Anaerolineae bacterium]NUQ07119.1 TetR/AcrR family transcriptional regulator [Anaerolineae bacterium]
MARIVNQDEHNAKRNEILDVTQQLIDTIGYERMTIKDILDHLQISKGALYHYFDSKPAILEALTQRMVIEFEQALLPITQDPDLPALEKLQRIFLTVIRSKAAQRTFVAALLRVWYTDDNAIVRQKIDEALMTRLVPLLALTIRQGIQEGVFTSAYPDHISEVIWSLLRGLQETPARLLLAYTPEHDEQQYVEGVISVHTAYMDTLERILGIPTGSLYRADIDTVKGWITALKSNVQSRSESPLPNQ